MIVAISLAIIPTQAFSVDRLEYNIDEIGTVYVSADYQLTFLESVALRVPTIRDEFTKAINTEYGNDAVVLDLTDTHTEFSIPKWADVKEDGYIQTPSITFSNVKNRIDSYWFLKPLNIDYTPAITIVRFPNGESFTYTEQMSFPSLSVKAL
jgi:hypothetical protein